MTPLALRITNFRSFKETATFTFPEQPGLYAMLGVNEVEPRLDANGSGKTTLWEALCWCVYDKVSTGLRAGDVNNWEAGKGTRVEFDFQVDTDDLSILYTLTRTWGPISFTLRARDMLGNAGDFDDTHDLAKSSNAPIMDLLRLEFAPFLQSVLMAQSQPMFLDLKHDQQASLFSEVMGLERWLEYSATASRKASEQDAVTRALERDMAQLLGQREALSRQDHGDAARDWEAERTRRAAKLVELHEANMDKRDKVKAELDELQEAETNARAAFSVAQRKAEEPSHELRRVESEHKGHEAWLASQTREVEALDAEVEHLTDKRTTDCPTCGHKMTRDEALSAITAARKKAVKAQGALLETKRAMGHLAERIRLLRRDVDDLVNAEREARDAMDDATLKTSNARRELQFLDRELDDIEDKAERLAFEKNPYQRLQDDAEHAAEQLAEQIARTQRRLDDSMHRHSLLSYWVRGFKEVRLQLIAEALTELEVEVNSCVTALGLVGWELKFQVDREGKGGNVQRGFSVLVKSPLSKALVPWRAWSGGEAQRLRLAGNMGLADLIRSRTGATLGLEVWDEPTQGLSAQGVDDLLECLAQRARTEGRQIWLVDHRAHTFGGFAGTATVVKTPVGSVVRQ